ncbi:MAG: DUF1592 domain-containing protein [Verrucomicrobiales bacterium]|nr:DUF1592 domain-containing protein [Verrucomicrobiales bacterium]
MSKSVRLVSLLCTCLLLSSGIAMSSDFSDELLPFFERHCYECHDANLKKGGLDLDALGTDLNDEALLAKWVRLYDRVATGEMPPPDQPRPGEGEKQHFRDKLAPALSAAHENQKGTVLRRLNRREYQNTLNDLLGIRLEAASLLPEDGRTGEFDNVGDSLGISASQLRIYLDLATSAIDLAIAKTTSPPVPTKATTTYAETQGADKFIGDAWHRAPDGAVVFFRELGYPTGMLREANAKESGYHRIRVTGYAYQSDAPVIFSVGGTTFARAAGRPTYGYFAFQPGKPQTIELTTWMDKGYMIEITTQGLHDPDYLIKKDGIANYKGPGLAISSVEIEGPITEAFPSRGHHLIFDGLDRREIEPRNPADKQKRYYVPKFEIVSANPTTDVIPALKRFASAAFRRPATEEDIAPYLILFQGEMTGGADFEGALRTALAAMLCSPDFLYLRERAGRLDDHALASRLSFFLTRTAPDEALSAAAAAGKLSQDGELLRAEAVRLLDAPLSDRFITDFTDSWLDLRNIEFTNPDEQLFPEFDRYLQDSMLAETRAYFRELIRENLDTSHLVKSDFAMLNQRLAAHYGIEGVTSPDVTRVSLPADSVRGGFMTQASVLKVSANGTNTSPVLRGVWINERILGKHPAPPPPGIPGVEPDIRGATTLRELLAKHRDSESCQACHEMIDPPGFALESFDPIGGWRDHFRSLGEGEKPAQRNAGSKRIQWKIGPPVDASGELQDGRAFAGYTEFRDLVAQDQALLAKAFVTKLLTFATGREMGFSDRPEINRIVTKGGESGYGIRDLVLLSVSSEIFRMK